MIVALLSVKGSPGVTTCAAGLTLAWRERGAVMVECDPAGGDVAAAVGTAADPGLVSLAAASRRTAGTGLVWEHVQRPFDGLAVVPAPPGAEQAQASVAALMSSPLLAEVAADPEVTLLVDCGRLDPGSSALPVLPMAAVVLVVVRPSRRELTHLAARLGAVLAAARPGAVRLLLAGRAEFPAAEISEALGGVPIAAHLPQDRMGASVLFTPAVRSWGGSRVPLMRELRSLALRLARNLDRRLPDTAFAWQDAEPGRLAWSPAEGEG